ncbi:flagellar biosynthesis protein FlhA [Gryllotalpicola sp.]|uniref:flagellar biosynthesis protein FlhA n=1 Tax=Gryllotalpicola sp. TaxID=1932787 RepID=UPI002628D682|nr:flagellar biosynthesis protein FlhA [Gryllotalpicola sp.]
MKNKKFSMIGVPLGVVGIVLLLVLPVPSWLLDVLLVINLVFVLLILLTTLFVKRPLDFSVFPSLLLVATLLRLGLSVASTRLVLENGFAGQVIQTFGEVAVGGSVVIGVVVFAILVVIQFIVVTKGAERVAEVGARFTLDAMPGKQMAIDADLSAGLISDAEAKERRAEIAAEADFYGAMDGASKFVKGDAIAGILVIVVNIIGGLVIGMLQHGLDFTTALNKYTLLTIGDGLSAQIPALLMAVSTGMIVTRSSASVEMGVAAAKQLGQSQIALMIAGGAAILLGLIPGMPFLAFAAVGTVLIVVSRRIASGAKKAQKVAERDAIAATGPRESRTEDLLEQMRVHVLEILLSHDLVDLVNGAQNDLLGRIKALRRKVALDLGFVVPPVRTRDSVDLPDSTYAIRLAGVEVARGTAPVGRLLALGDFLDALPGESVVEPVFGLPGKWIPAELRNNAEMQGATVIDRVSVIVTHLSAIISDNAAKLLSREDVRVLVDGVKATNPAAVDELIPAPLSLAEVQRVLQGLLAEQVAINDLPRLFEALSLAAKISTDPEALIEAARESLGPAIAARYLENGTLRVLMIEPSLEQTMLEGLRQGPAGSQILLDGSQHSRLVNAVKQTVAAAAAEGQSPVLVCAPQLRSAVRRLVSAQQGGLPVLSYNEATASPSTIIETIGVIRLAQHSLA